MAGIPSPPPPPPPMPSMGSSSSSASSSSGSHSAGRSSNTPVSVGSHVCMYICVLYNCMCFVEALALHACYGGGTHSPCMLWWRHSLSMHAMVEALTLHACYGGLCELSNVVSALQRDGVDGRALDGGNQWTKLPLVLPSLLLPVCHLIWHCCSC